ncbi:MAG: hypothetical protein QF745_11530 [Planctomycetota bacterium]|nr:hypothetical protein [Planctomycetota bacterium]|tara:strand:- start:15445 stop:16023 length:579 start_codon:yes stop_codon:yes gene_type:complete
MPLLLALLGAILPACSTCQAEAKAYTLRPDFSTPEATGHSFLAALSCDNGPAEYACLSERMKRKHGATLDAWLIARVEIREEVGWLIRQAFSLQPLSSESVPGGVLVWWGQSSQPLLGLVMEKQHFFDLYEREGRKFGSFLQNPPPIRVEGKRLSVSLEDPVLRTVPEGAHLTGLTIGSEWKVLDFQLPATP